MGRYTVNQRQKILDYIEKLGRGGITRAVEKYGVTAATIRQWQIKAGRYEKLKEDGTGTLAQLKMIKELHGLQREIEVTKHKLSKLKLRYQKVKRAL